MNLTQSLLVGPSGRALFGVGGENAYATHEYKGYRVSLEWDEADGEPMLLIWPATNFLEREVGVFGIGLSSAGKYADPSGRPTPQCFEECACALPTLNKALLPIEVHTLVDVVMRFIPDLIVMPPAPKALRRAARGEALIDITQVDSRGKTISEVSV
jgi:hypothetical protein